MNIFTDLLIRELFITKFDRSLAYTKVLFQFNSYIIERVFSLYSDNQSHDNFDKCIFYILSNMFNI